MQEKDTYSSILGREYTSEELKELEKRKELKKKLEEACFKYFEATYLERGEESLSLIDYERNGDKLLLAFQIKRIENYDTMR